MTAVVAPRSDFFDSFFGFAERFMCGPDSTTDFKIDATILEKEEQEGCFKPCGAGYYEIELPTKDNADIVADDDTVATVDDESSIAEEEEDAAEAVAEKPVFWVRMNSVRADLKEKLSKKLSKSKKRSKRLSKRLSSSKSLSKISKSSKNVAKKVSKKSKSENPAPKRKTSNGRIQEKSGVVRKISKPKLSKLKLSKKPKSIASEETRKTAPGRIQEKQVTKKITDPWVKIKKVSLKKVSKPKIKSSLKKLSIRKKKDTSESEASDAPLVIGICKSDEQ